MRVIVATPDYPPATGGIQRLIGELVSRAAWESLVVTRGHVDFVDARATHRVKVWPASSKASQLLLNAAVLRRGQQWRPDAVLSGHIATSPGALALGRVLGVPVLQYVHAKEMKDRRRLARFALSRVTATIAVSAHTAQLAMKAGAPPNRVTTIEPGVDAVAELPAGQEAPPTILTVARLSDRYKGFDVLLRSLPLVRSRVPDVRWVVVGDGELRQELEAIAAVWGLSDSVLFAGSVTDAERDLWYARSHVFAMPSRVPADGGGEGCGLVYLEAGVRGLPCIAGDAGAVAETVVDEETGLLVDARDHVALADALVTLLSDRQRAMQLGNRGREHARERSWERMVQEVEALVKRTVTAWPGG